MLQQALPLVFLVFSLMFSIFFVSTANTTIYVHCSQLDFTSMSPYESNVNSLLTSLDDSASIYSFNKLETSPQNDKVYGLFQCRGDLSTLDCKDCVTSAISQLKTTCLMSTGGEIQLEGCYVKYDNESFFGVEDKMEVWKRCGPSISYNSDVVNRIDGALVYLVGGNGQYYRGGNFGSIQGVAQCVQDLSLSDCQDCLSEARERLRTECVTSTWGDMYLRKCYIRYADQDNGNPNSNSNKSGGGSKNNILKWIGFIIAAAVGAGSLTFAAKNSCNLNIRNTVTKIFKKEMEGVKKETESAKSEAKSAREKAEKVEKMVKDRSTQSSKESSKDYTSSYSMLMPPPPQYVYYSNDPNTCCYL